MDKRLVHLLEHSLGNKTHYRNHFACSKGHADYEDIQWLVNHGFMRHYRTDSESGLEFYCVTDAGKAIAFRDIK